MSEHDVNAREASLGGSLRGRVRDTAACPRCGVAAGEPCVGAGGGIRRKGKNHRERTTRDPNSRAAL